VMGGKKKYINIFGSFTESFMYYLPLCSLAYYSRDYSRLRQVTHKSSKEPLSIRGVDALPVNQQMVANH